MKSRVDDLALFGGTPAFHEGLHVGRPNLGSHERFIEQMRRVLRPGGRLILVDGFRDRPLGWLFFDVIVERIEKSVHHASRAELGEMARVAGLTSIRQYTFNPVPPLLATVAEG